HPSPLAIVQRSSSMLPRPPPSTRFPYTTLFRSLLAARSQIGVSLAFHIVFAVVGIAMPVMMVVAERRWQVTGHAIYLDLAQRWRSEEHTSELQSHLNLVCRLTLEKKKITITKAA